MAVTNITYSADTAIAVTLWGTGLAGGQYATSSLFDNHTTTKYVDALVGGLLEAGTVTGTLAAGESLDLYIIGQYDTDTAGDVNAGIEALLIEGAELADSTAFVKENLILMTSIQLESGTPDTSQMYHWGPIGVAQFFGGIMPKEFMILLHNNTGGTMVAGSDVNLTGITYTSA